MPATNIGVLLRREITPTPRTVFLMRFFGRHPIFFRRFGGPASASRPFPVPRTSLGPTTPSPRGGVATPRHSDPEGPSPTSSFKHADTLCLPPASGSGRGTSRTAVDNNWYPRQVRERERGISSRRPASSDQQPHRLWHPHHRPSAQNPDPAQTRKPPNRPEDFFPLVPSRQRPTPTINDNLKTPFFPVFSSPMR